VNTSWEIAKFEVCAQKWIDLSEGNQGVSLINDCKYGFDVRGNTMRMSLLRSPKAPDPECDMGVHRFSYALVPHTGSYHHAGVVAAAYAFNAPVRHAFLEPRSGEAGVLPAFVVCEDRNIVLEAVKKAEDSSDIIVRVYECHNCRGIAKLFLARNPRSAALCDMEENEIGELEISQGLVIFTYKPFEIITIKLKF
jgi:alpha-mannosidase